MDLRAKIERLRPMTPTIDDLRSRVEEIMARPIEAPPVRSTPRVCPVPNEPVAMEPNHVHGRVPVVVGRNVDASVAAALALDATIVDIDMSKALYLDVESTGLYGSGVVPFLIGLGWFEDDSFVLEQLFLEELGQERELYERLSARIRAASCLITYNGKSYDLPIIAARYVMNRVPIAPARPHIDLLHCARRVYRRRIGRCRLIDLEEQVLGMRRERDVDGAEIPGLYWSFLRHRNETAMAPVIEHNANDVVALAAVLGHLCERFASVFSGEDPEDQLSRAIIATRAKDMAHAAAFAEAAAVGGGDEALTVEAFTLLGTLARKQGNHEGAARAWERALRVAGDDRALAQPVHLLLAKHYEHRIKDLPAALVHALRTGELKRIERLRRRLTRSRPQS